MTTETEYLKNYRASDFASPLVTVDAALFTFHEGVLKILLVERSIHPEKGKWALPGGFVDMHRDQSIEDTALRKIRDKTGVEPPYLEQLQTLGNAGRDKRGWSVTVCYTALIAHQECAPHIETVSDAEWIELERAKHMSLAFDHLQIIQAARDRLKQKALYSLVPAFSLPEKFTLPELQQVHEALIGKPLEKKSFRRRIEQADLLVDTGEKKSLGRRPAALYRMKESSGAFTFVRNLEE